MMQTALVIAFALAASTAGQQTAIHTAQMNHRGAMVMGFDQDKTAHHFYLYADGGAIDVSVNDVTDKTNMDAIRAHLPHIVTMFSQGNFDAPMLVHGTEVPGTPGMKKVRHAIAWKYEESAKGGRVTIHTTNADALNAVHEFLRYQITDHKTGDSLSITKRR